MGISTTPRSLCNAALCRRREIYSTRRCYHSRISGRDNNLSTLSKQNALSELPCTALLATDKVVDDGLCTVLALQRTHKVFSDCAAKTPKGKDWPANLVNTLEIGAPAVVHTYEDDADFELWEVWNSSKHNEELKKLRKTAPSTFLAIAYKPKRSKDCGKAPKYSLGIDWSGRQATVYR